MSRTADEVMDFPEFVVGSALLQKLPSSTGDSWYEPRSEVQQWSQSRWISVPPLKHKSLHYKDMSTEVIKSTSLSDATTATQIHDNGRADQARGLSTHEANAMSSLPIDGMIGNRERISTSHDERHTDGLRQILECEPAIAIPQINVDAQMRYQVADQPTTSIRNYSHTRHSTYIPPMAAEINERFIPPPNSCYSSVYGQSAQSTFPSQSQRSKGFKLYRRNSYSQSYSHSHSHSNRPGSYVAIDPFQPSIAQYASRYGLGTTEGISEDEIDTSVSIAGRPTLDISAYIFAFFLDTLPRQVYLHFLLRLPSLYFSRVTRIFEEAEITMPEIRKMAIETTNRWNGSTGDLGPATWNLESSIIIPPYANLKATWESFIDSLLKEWKTLNIVSVLLLSAILTILQIESAAADPVTRYSALLSLVCALVSLLYGCIYIIRFGTMRKAYKAAEWAEEAQKSTTFILWNVWVLLAMPATWLSWSIMLYITCIMSFVWRTGSTADAVNFTLSPQQALVPRVIISVVLGLGILYFLLIVGTFRRYGDVMDRTWRNRVIGWTQDKRSTANHGTATSSSYPAGSYVYARSPTESLHSWSPQPNISRPTSPFGRQRSPSPPSLRPTVIPPSESSILSYHPSFLATKVLDLRFMGSIAHEIPQDVLSHGILHETWDAFADEASKAWDGQPGLFQNDDRFPARMSTQRPQDLVARILEWWNLNVFYSHEVQTILCQEFLHDDPESPAFVIYLIDFSPQDGYLRPIDDRFGSVPEGLDRIDIFDPLTRETPRSRDLGRTSVFAKSRSHGARVHFQNSSAAVEPSVPSGSRDDGDQQTADDEPATHSLQSPVLNELPLMGEAPESVAPIQKDQLLDL